MFSNHVINSFRTFHGGGYGVYQSTPNIPQGVASMDVDLPGAPNKKKARPLIGYKREYRHWLAILLLLQWNELVLACLSIIRNRL